MKLFSILFVTFFTNFTYANMTIDNGVRLFSSEIECLESRPSSKNIQCKVYSDTMGCSTTFDARIVNGGVKSVTVQTLAKIQHDSKLWQTISFGLTDKINVASARSEAKIELRSLMAKLKKLQICN